MNLKFEFYGLSLKDRGMWARRFVLVVKEGTESCRGGNKSGIQIPLIRIKKKGAEVVG